MPNPGPAPHFPVLNKKHPLARRLMMCFPLQEPGGDTAFDLSGYGSHGTFINGLPQARPRGNHGRYVVFEKTGGANDEKINIPSEHLWEMHQGFPRAGSRGSTLSCVFAFNGDNDNKVLFGRNETTPAGDFAIMSGKGNPKNRFMGRSIWVGSSTQAVTTAVLTTGQVYHGVVVLSNYIGIKLYLDGVKVAEDLENTGRDLLTDVPVQIGGRYFAGSETATDADIYDCRYWNRALSAAEVAEMFADPWALYRKQRVLITVASAAKTATGALTLPIPTLAGVGEVGNKTATGALTLPVPTIAGVAEVGRKTSTGALTLPIPTIAGVGVVGAKTATGALTLLLPTIAGVGEVGEKTATGALTLPIPTIAGVAVLTGLRTATGALTLPVPTVAGVGEVGEKTATGALTLPLPTLAGVGQVALKTATGALTLPLPTIAGVGQLQLRGVGALTLPLPTVAGVGEVGFKTATGALTLPVPTVAGVGVVPIVGTGALTLPLPTIAGVAVLTGLRTATGALTIPLPTIAGVGAVGEKTATGALTLLLPTIAGVGQVGTKTATGALTLLLPTLAGVGQVGAKTATGALTLPLPTVAGVGSVTSPSVPKTATGALTLLIPTVAGVGTLTGLRTATGALTLPLPTLAGVGALGISPQLAPLAGSANSILVPLAGTAASVLLPLPGGSPVDKNRDFEIVRGTDVQQPLNPITLDQGRTLDDGETWEAQFKKDKTDATALLTLDTAGGGITTDANFEPVLVFTPSDTPLANFPASEEATSYWWGCEMTKAGKLEATHEGKMLVITDVAQP